jgi:hypothetical protein
MDKAERAEARRAARIYDFPEIYGYDDSTDWPLARPDKLERYRAFDVPSRTGGQVCFDAAALAD